MSTMAKAARHVATTAGAAERSLQQQVYPIQTDRATANWLEQAADVLCLLTLIPLGATARAGYSALLERRLRHAYEGATR